jgi:hypothetical protein
MWKKPRSKQVEEAIATMARTRSTRAFRTVQLGTQHPVDTFILFPLSTLGSSIYGMAAITSLAIPMTLASPAPRITITVRILSMKRMGVDGVS